MDDICSFGLAMATSSTRAGAKVVWQLRRQLLSQCDQNRCSQELPDATQAPGPQEVPAATQALGPQPNASVSPPPIVPRPPVPKSNEAPSSVGCSIGRIACR